MKLLLLLFSCLLIVETRANPSIRVSSSVNSLNTTQGDDVSTKPILPFPFSSVLNDDDDHDWEGDGGGVQDIPRYNVVNESEEMIVDVTFLGEAPSFEDDEEKEEDGTVVEEEESEGLGDGFNKDQKPSRKRKKGRKHCYKSSLYCANNARCCTHVSKGEVWCCPRKARCGNVPHTCRRRRHN